MSIHLVIVNYRTPDDLEQCLTSLMKHEPTTRYRVTVYNNDPTGRDMEVAEQFATTGWHIVNDENVGYARACNNAGTAGCDVAGFFNADVEFTENVIDACHDGLMGNDRWGVLGPRQVDKTGRITHAGIVGTRDRPVIRGWRKRGSLYLGVDEAVVSVSGSAYFVKRQAWDELTTCPIYQKALESFGLRGNGPFLPTRHYYEETWVSYHAQEHDWDVVYWGCNTMIHKWHQASPLGGAADQMMPASRRLFRDACDFHGIDHD